MKPTLSLSRENHDNTINYRLSERIFNKISCPDGTVPFEELLTMILLDKKRMPPPDDASFSTSLSYGNNFSNKVSFPSKGYKLAIVGTENNPSTKFWGAGMQTAIYNSRVEG
ncbi:hypothetical protein H5410_000913 [Solanum commersonii]|uniref:Uncharacterized protein n=1 Tax=Solanum commersonii TaxID=4109 RepID=A0A9J6AXL2_SOLCO|nr:hypothetical protein H5410_000913 [Solanum commersonii]